MTVAPLIAMKGSSGMSFEAVGKELDRRAHTYVNDVDRSRSGMNVNYCVRPTDREPMPLEKAIERRLGELNVKRRIRANQVRAVGFIVSTNDHLDDAQAHAFLNEALAWFSNRYGSENLLAAAEHFDEGTPHLQFWIAPVVHDADGHDRLCCKELFSPDKTRKNPETGKSEVVEKGTMSRLQEDFWREVASRYGYERPLTKEQRKKGYRSLDAYKQHEGLTRELKAETKQLEEGRDQARAEQFTAAQQAAGARAQAEAAALELEEQRAEIKRAREQLSYMKEQVKEEKERLEGVRRAVESRAGEVKEARREGDELESRVERLEARLELVPKEDKAARAGMQAARERRIGLAKRASDLRECLRAAVSRLDGRNIVARGSVAKLIKSAAERLSVRLGVYPVESAMPKKPQTVETIRLSCGEVASRHRA